MLPGRSGRPCCIRMCTQRCYHVQCLSMCVCGVAPLPCSNISRPCFSGLSRFSLGAGAFAPPSLPYLSRLLCMLTQSLACFCARPCLLLTDLVHSKPRLLQHCFRPKYLMCACMLHACMHVSVHVGLCMCACDVCMYVCMHACMHVCM